LFTEGCQEVHRDMIGKGILCLLRDVRKYTGLIKEMKTLYGLLR